MVVSRRRPKGAKSYASFGLGVLVMGLMPRTIGYQDLAHELGHLVDPSMAGSGMALKLRAGREAGA